MDTSPKLSDECLAQLIQSIDACFSNDCSTVWLLQYYNFCEILPGSFIMYSRMEIEEFEILNKYIHNIFCQKFQRNNQKKIQKVH